MPNETKKRWLVETYGTVTLEIAKEARDFEDKLNTFAARNYEIYEVCFEKKTIVGRLVDDHYEEDDEEVPPVEVRPLTGMPEAASGVVRSFMESLAERRAMMQQVAERAAGAPPTEGPSNLLVLTGAMTGQLLHGIRAVSMAADLGDVSGDRRLDGVIQNLFKKAPTIEAQKSLEDIEKYHARYRRDQCDDPDCVTNKLLVSTQEKLKAHLAATPLN